MVKLEHFCDGPFELDPTLFSESDLPTLQDLFNHYLYLVVEAQKLDNGRYSTKQVLARVANDVISIYKSLAVPTIGNLAVER